MSLTVDLKESVLKECELIDAHISGLRNCPSREVLDVGYGDGRAVAYFLTKGYRVTGVDKYHTRQQALIKNLASAGIPNSDLHLNVRDVKDLEFEVKKYALVILSHVLHFIEGNEAQAVLAKAAKAIASNGMILIRAHHKSHPMKNQIAFKKVYKHFFSKSEIERHFEQDFRLLPSADIFGGPPQMETDKNSHEGEGQQKGKSDFGILSEEWRDVEYLYQRIA